MPSRIDRKVQLQIVDLAAKGYPKIYIAEQLKLHVNTVYAWLKKPEIAKLIAESTSEDARRISRKATNACEKAINFLESVLNDDEATTEQKFRAVENLLKENANNIKNSNDYLIHLIEKELDPDGDEDTTTEPAEESEEEEATAEPEPLESKTPSGDVSTGVWFV